MNGFCGLMEKTPVHHGGLHFRVVISRVLYPLRGDDHLSGRIVTDRLKRPTRISNSRGPQPVLADGFLLGLAPDEVYRAIPVARNAVSSYLAISPLPRRAETRAGRFAFCCTVCRVSAPGRYPASCPVVPGLSSSIAAGGHPLPRSKIRKRGRLVQGVNKGLFCIFTLFFRV